MTASGGRFIEVAGRRLFIEEWGSGPPLLCLHGLGGGTHFFSELGTLLSTRHRTIAFDFPGAGQSPSTLPISFEAFAEIVVALAAALNVSDPTLLGHSMGTIVGLEAIRVSPRLTSRFIAVGGVLPGAAHHHFAYLGLLRVHFLAYDHHIKKNRITSTKPKQTNMSLP